MVAIDHNDRADFTRVYSQVVPLPSTREDTATRVRVESFNSGGVDLEDWVSVAESIAPRTIDRIKLAGRCTLSQTSRMIPTVF